MTKSYNSLKDALLNGDEPTNPVTDSQFTGKNARILLLEAAEKGYTCHEWVMFHQAKELGLQVKKGETGTRVYYTVFNRDQLEPIAEKK